MRSHTTHSFFCLWAIKCCSFCLECLFLLHLLGPSGQMSWEDLPDSLQECGVSTIVLEHHTHSTSTILMSACCLLSYMAACLARLNILKAVTQFTYSPWYPQPGTDTQIISKYGFKWIKEWVNDWVNKLLKRLSWFKVKLPSFSPLTCHPWICVYWKPEFFSHLCHSLAHCSVQQILNSASIITIPKFSVVRQNKSLLLILNMCPV